MWDDLQTGLGVQIRDSVSIKTVSIQVWTGRTSKFKLYIRRSSFKLSKYITALKRSTDIMASDEWHIDKLLNHAVMEYCF